MLAFLAFCNYPASILCLFSGFWILRSAGSDLRQTTTATDYDQNYCSVKVLKVDMDGYCDSQP